MATYAEYFGAVFPAEADVRSTEVYGPRGTDLIGELMVGGSDTPVANVNDIDDHVTGDTFAGKTFTALDAAGDAVDLTGATITMEFRRGKRPAVATMVLGTGLSVVTAASGTFKIDEQVIAWEPSVYSFDAEVELAGGDVITTASGRWAIIDDVTVPS